MSYLETARAALATWRAEVTVPTEKTVVVVEANEDFDWWSILTPEEREELKPRPIKRRCPWCKQIRHTALCDELRPKRLMPIGKYKGQPIEDLPRDYVHWLANSTVRLDSDTRNEIYDRFGAVIYQQY